jgi:hypothetical protein
MTIQHRLAIPAFFILTFLVFTSPAEGTSFTVTDSQFVGGVYDFHYYTFANTDAVTVAKRTVINGVNQGISDPTISKHGWELGDPYTPNIGYWAAIGPHTATQTSGTITMGWDFSAVTRPIAKVEIKTRHILFQFGDFITHAIGDRIDGYVATPSIFGTGPYSEIYSMVAPASPTGTAVASQSIIDITSLLPPAWLSNPKLLELKFTYFQTPDPTIPGRHIQIFRDNTGTGDDGFLLRVTLAESVTIDGPATGLVNDLLPFSASCGQEGLRTGWTWSAPGGTIRGQADARAIGITYADTGTYSVTATHPSCADPVSSRTITIASRGPQIVLATAPRPLVQIASTGGATTTYVIRNVGDATTTVTFDKTGDFFTQTPSVVNLAPGAIQRVTITGLAQPAGVYDGVSRASGVGIPPGAAIPIRLLSTPTSPAGVVARPRWNRIDTSGQAGSTTTASIDFTNTGSSQLQGIVISSEPWIRPPAGLITIDPGQTRAIDFPILRLQRPDSTAARGSAYGDLTLIWSGTRSNARGTFSSAPSLAAPVGVNDTVKPSTSTAAIPALGPGELAWFVPGVGHVTGSVGVFLSDLTITNLTRGETLPEVSFYFNPIGGSAASAQSTSLSSVVPNKPVAYSDVVNSVFGSTTQLGSLQVRTPAPDKLAVAANVFNSSNAAGTYGTMIPAVRSDRGAGPGDSVHLTGLRSSESSHTNLYIQELSGESVQVTTEFRTASGQVVGTRTDDVPGFGLIQNGAVVPAGGVSAVLTNSGTTGRFFAYATPVDKLSGDTWAVSDWARQYGYSRAESMIFPVAGALRGANDTFFRTDVAIINTSSSAPATGTLRYVSREGQAFERDVDIPAKESLILDDVTGSFFGVTGDTVGYILWIPSMGEVAMTSRNYTTAAGQNATFGSAVPALALSQGLALGDLRRMAGLEDAAFGTIQDARPASFRTNFGLVETSGNTVTVRVTMRYDVGGALAQTRRSAFLEYSLAPNQFLQVNNISHAILGEGREEELGDLRNVEVDFEVVEGSGTIQVFVSSIDNGTGDSLLRTE